MKKTLAVAAVVLGLAAATAATSQPAPPCPHGWILYHSQCIKGLG